MKNKDIMLLNACSVWPIKKLGQLFNERKQKVSDVDFSPLSVTKNGIVPQLDSAAKTDDGDNRKLVLAGDYVINSRSDRKGSGGLSELDGSVSLINIVLKPKGIYPRFAHHLMRSQAFQEEFYRWGHGIVADLWTTRFYDMKNIRLAIPDYETQKQIADFLDRETTRIDLLIEKKQQLLLLLNQKIKNTISNAVVGSCKIINELQRKPIKLKYATEVISHKLPYAEIDAPYIGMEHIKSWSGEIEENHEAQPEGLVSLFKSGDILFGKLRPNLCKVALPYFDGVCSTELLVLRPNKNVLGSYLRLTLSEQSFIEGVVASTYGAKMPRASWEYIGSVKIDLPSIEHQHQIVDYLKTKIAQTESLSKSIEMSLQGLRELRASLITAAVTGQLDITTWQQRDQTERHLERLETKMAG